MVICCWERLGDCFHFCPFFASWDALGTRGHWGHSIHYSGCPILILQDASYGNGLLIHLYPCVSFAVSKLSFCTTTDVYYESGLLWGVEWWKYWFCSFFWDMEMVCTWSHKSRLSRILHFLQRCCLFRRMIYLLLSILEKKTCLYTMILMPAMNSALYCCTYYHMYIYIYNIIYYIIYTHYLTNLLFFHNSLCFSINTYLILNIHECILK